MDGLQTHPEKCGLVPLERVPSEAEVALRGGGGTFFKSVRLRCILGARWVPRPGKPSGMVRFGRLRSGSLRLRRRARMSRWRRRLIPGERGRLLSCFHLPASHCGDRTQGCAAVLASPQECPDPEYACGTLAGRMPSAPTSRRRFGSRSGAHGAQHHRFPHRIRAPSALRRSVGHRPVGRSAPRGCCWSAVWAPSPRNGARSVAA